MSARRFISSSHRLVALPGRCAMSVLMHGELTGTLER